MQDSITRSSWVLCFGAFCVCAEMWGWRVVVAVEAEAEAEAEALRWNRGQNWRPIYGGFGGCGWVWDGSGGEGCGLCGLWGLGLGLEWRVWRLSVCEGLERAGGLGLDEGDGEGEV